MRTNKTNFICISVVFLSLFFSLFNNSNGSLKSVTSSAGPTDSVLVIMNDSTVGTSTAKRKADRDTLRKYIPMLVSKVRYITKDSNTVFPNLSNFSIIIYQETSFDDPIVRALSVAQRQAIKNWLESGTPSARKGLLMIGADLGYNYDQTGAPNWDTVFSRRYGGFQYINDNAATTATWASVGAASSPGSNFNTMSISPPAGGYWPDGCRRTPDGNTSVFNVYMNRMDTVAGITKSGAPWNVVSTFQDPRYFTGAGDGTGDIGFKRVLKNMIAWVKVIGGCFVTTVEPLENQTVSSYKLSQNYPNPFNPVTRIEFDLIKSGYTLLIIYSITGKEVAKVVDEHLSAGSYSVDFDASQLPSGAYFYSLTSNNFIDTKKMLVIK